MSDTMVSLEAKMENIITKELLEKALLPKEKEHNVFVKTFTITSGCKEGENFTSTVVSVKVTLQTGDQEVIHHLFVKIPIKEGVIKHFVETQVDFYAKESIAYLHIIPAMVQLQMDKGLEPIHPSFPMHYYSKIDGVNGILVLRDIRPDGYVLLDIRKGLDEAHCRLVMKEIATFHALGFSLNSEEKKEYCEAMKETVVASPMPVFFLEAYSASLMLAKQLTKDEKILCAITKLENLDVYNFTKELIKPIEPYAVICHGDLWCNNMLFRYDVIDDTGEPIDVKLLDLQIARYARPTTDLAYFFFTSTSRAMRKKNLTMLLTLYYKEITEHLKRLGTKIPGFTFDFFMDMYKQSALFGLIMLCIFVFNLLSRPGTATDYSQNENAQSERRAEQIAQLLANKENQHILQDRLIGGIEEAIEMGLI